ncbi:MAG: ABC-F family ATP-binding cassette domain-containing protein [Alphaproteobacteria bacterium]|nr:ABC-F family ATP-binding cassette domain-containing protein [Alphaproteobacteria bacterium]
MLGIDRLVYRISGRTIIDGASARIPEGHRVGLVGRNGAGKTTLLGLIAGTLQADDGAIRLPRESRVGWVAQEAPGGDATPLATVLAADVERARLLAELESAPDPARIAAIEDRLAVIGARAAPARAGSILHGLGFDAADQARPLREFSGGLRMRVALAAALFARPDLLLLDEPTNHLDLEATLWLVGFLKRWPRTLLLVSHDRDLLDEVPDHTLHLEAGQLTLYRGGYSSFARTRAERLELQEKQRVRIERERARLQAFVDRFRAKASKATQAQSRVKMLARLETVAPVVEEDTPALDFPEPKPLASPILTLDEVAVGYDGKPILQRLSLSLDFEDRIALIGANGNGKTTFAKLLAGRLEPLAGELRRVSRLTVGYFAQHQIEDLDPARSAFQHLAEDMPGVRIDRVRAFLGRFGFPGERADVAAAKLSGGEKARLALARIARAEPQLLILDEPTNHLDIDARAALVQALNAFPGAVVVISHDRRLIELTADRLWLVAEGRVTPFAGGIADYQKKLMAERGGASEERSGTARPSEDSRRLAAERRAQMAPLRKKAQAAEAAMARLARERAALEKQMADPAVYTGAGQAVAELARRKAALDRELAAAEAEWLAAAEALETDGAA